MYFCPVSLKVVHLNASSSGGAFQVAQRLHSAMRNQGLDSHHLVLSGPPSKEYTIWADTLLKRIYVLFLHLLEKLDFLRFDRNKILRFKFSHGLTGVSILKHPLVKDADVIHLHWINKGYISIRGISELLKSSKKIVWTSHDLWPYSGGWYHLESEYLGGASIGKGLVTLSNRVKEQQESTWGTGQIQFIAPSNWLADRARSLMPKVKVNVIPNGLDIHKFKPNASANLREKLGFLEDTFILVFSASNLKDSNKNINDFVKIVNFLAKEDGNIGVILIGSRAEDIEIDQSVKTYFTGYVKEVDELVSYYSISNAYVSTSLMETFPTTIMESHTCMLPAYGYKVGGVPEMIGEDYLVERGDWESLASKILHFKHLSNSMNIREALLEKARKKYDIQIIAKHVIELYSTD